MKKVTIILIALILAIFLFTLTSYAGSWNGWIYQNPYPTKNTLLGVKFVTPQKGWVVGEHGTILYTEDGGENWEAQESGTEEDLKSVTFMNEKIGWAVGNGGVIIHTADAGKKWERQGNAKDHLHIVFFINEKEGWIGGGIGTFLHTKDGGKNWNKENIGAKGDDISGIFFLNSSMGWALSGGKVYRTKDGKTWEVSELPSVPFLAPSPREHGWQGSVYFINEKKGWATVGFDYMFSTEDGGKTWKSIKVSNSVDRIAFTDEKNGCMAAGSIICTEDGGKTWTERLGTKPGRSAEVEGYSVAIWGLSFADKTTGWAVGKNGQIFKTEDNGKTWKAKSRKYHWDIYFLDSKTGWAIENDYKRNKGSIVKTEDGGKTWEVQKTFDARIEIKSFFINPTMGWAIGQEKGSERSGGSFISNHFILHTNNGGQTWLSQFKETAKTSAERDIFNTFADVFFVNPDLGWVAGYNGMILHTKDGGKNWVRNKSGIKSQLWRVQFIDDKKGWIIGNMVTEGSGVSTILYTKDGGERWSVQWKKKTGWMWLQQLQFVDESNGWAIGEITEYSGDGILVQTADGGKTWTEKEFKEIYFDKIFFLDKDRGVILTEKEQMLITHDSGKTWDKQRIPIRKYPWHVSEIFLEKKIDK